MGALRGPDGHIVVLHTRHTFGRSRRMDTQLSSAESSAQHAVITWNGEGWVLRDLGSRNGTFLNGVALTPSVDTVCVAGDAIAMGALQPHWTLVDATAPGLFAQSGDKVVHGTGGILALPIEDDPRVVIMHGPRDIWLLCQGESEIEVHDGHQLVLDDITWTLGIPEKTIDTVMVDEPLSLADAGLDFRVSSDEEYVEVTLRLKGVAHTLPARTHHYLMLIMARARLADMASGGLVSSHGWLYRSDLQDMLKVDRNRLNLGLHRARKELADFGLSNAHDLIERRPTSQQMRLGIGDITVATL